MLVRGGDVFCFFKGGSAVLRPITSRLRLFCSDWGCRNGIVGGRSISVAERTRLATRLIIEGPGRYADGRKMMVFVSLQPCMQCKASGPEGSRETSAGLCFLPDFFVYGILIMRIDVAQDMQSGKIVRCQYKKVVVIESCCREQRLKTTTVRLRLLIATTPPQSVHAHPWNISPRASCREAGIK